MNTVRVIVRFAGYSTFLQQSVVVVHGERQTTKYGVSYRKGGK